MSFFPRDGELCQLFLLGKTLAERWRDRRREEGEMKEDQICLFALTDSSQSGGFVSLQFVRKQQEKTLWFYYSDGKR